MKFEYARGHRSGFTLVELLLVIAIVAVLVAILMPAVSKAKSETQRLMCMSAQRQLIVLQTCYQTDNRGLYCHNALPGPGMITADISGGTDKSSGWVNYMCDYKNEVLRESWGKGLAEHRYVVVCSAGRLRGSRRMSERASRRVVHGFAQGTQRGNAIAGARRI